MKKLLLACWLIIAMLSVCDAQESKKGGSFSKSKIRAQDAGDLLDRAGAVREKDPAAALDLLKQSLAISISEKDIFNQAVAYLLLGEINQSISEWTLANENFGNAYARLKDTYPNSNEYKRALAGLGNTYLGLAQFDLALQYYNQLGKLKLTTAEATDLHLDISDVYFQQGDYPAALNEVTLAERAAGKVGNKAVRLRIQNQQARIYAKTNNVDKARAAYENSFPLRSSEAPQQKMDDASLRAAKDEIITTLQEQNRVDDEIDLRNQSIDQNQAAGNLKEVSSEKVALGSALERKGETANAIREVEEAARIADKLQSPKEQENAFLALAELYEKNGSSRQSLDTYKKYSAAVKKSEALNENRSIARAELIRKQKDIEALAKTIEIGYQEETIRQQTVFRQQLVIYGLLFIVGVIAITSYFIYKNARASKKANQLLALKSLRGQMNPHFIFNALNSVNHFIAQNDERTANRFLSEFSQLMRLVLENSQEDFISLYKEQEIVSLYLKLEHYRFRDKFEYEITIDESINTESVDLPPMLIQPYIENAVWHGLRYKNEKGFLSVRIKQSGENLQVEITDNGIGRTKSMELKTENQKRHHSTGVKNIEQRMRIINNVYGASYQVVMSDLDPVTHEGTRVLLTLPMHNHQHRK